MMRRLFIDTSCDNLSIVLHVDGAVCSAVKIHAGRRMSEMLLEQIDNILSCAAIGAEDIDEFYAVTGPGSFTGVRIGVAMVLGLSEGVSKPAYGLTSLDLAALASGRTSVTAASRLKGDVFAVRKYDFANDVFSEYFCDEISERNTSDFLIVNSMGYSGVDLEKALHGETFLKFRASCEPIYLRKAEAELEFDNKSIGSRAS